VVQFAEPGPSHAGSRPMVPPRGVPGAPPPVKVLGLKMRCQSVERALTQWTTVLQGSAANGPRGERVFSWSGSPMRLVVEIDPVQNEGPVAVELASRRRLSLPAGPHPVLGTVFRQEEV